MNTLKHAALLMLLFLPFLAFSQSPQCLNFTATGYLGNPVIQGNDIWFPAVGALVKMDKTTGAQTVYRPDNSNMVGMGVSCLALSPNGTLWGGGKFGFWQFDGTNFTNYTTTVNGDTIKDVCDIEWDAVGNVYIYALFDPIAYKWDVLKFDGATVISLNMPTVYSYSSYNQNIMCVKNNGEIFLANGTGPTNDSCFNYTGFSWNKLALPSNDYHCFVKNNNQQIIALPSTFGPSGATIYTLSGTTWLPFTCNWTIAPPSNVYAEGAIIDSNNDIFVYRASQMIQISGNNMTLSSYGALPIAANDREFEGIAHDTNADIWLTYTDSYTTIHETTQNQIIKYANGQWTPYDYYSEVGSWYWLRVDQFNRKWIYGYDRISLFNGSTWDEIQFPFNMTMPTWESFTFDQYGDLWIILSNSGGGGMDGIYKYDGNWTYIHSTVGFADIAIDNLGRICTIGSDNVDYFDGMLWYNYNTFTFPATPFMEIQSVLVDSNNIFWLFDNSGQIATFDGTNFNLQPVTVPYVGIEAQTTFDNSGRIWINNADMNSVFVIDGLNVIEYSDNTIPNLNGASIYWGCQDLNGNDWLTTSGGLFKKNGNNWTHYYPYNSDIAANYAMQLYVDNANNLWFFNPNGITVFNESGLINNSLETNYNTCQGNIYLDLNANGQKDTSEYHLYSQRIHVLPDNINVYSNSNGNYQYFPPAGNHSLAINSYPNWQLSSDSAIYHVVAGNSRDSLDFGLIATTQKDSIELTLYAGQTRCNSQVPYWAYYKNKGTTTLSGSVAFTIDPLTSLMNAFPLANSNASLTYTWNFQNLLPFQTQSIYINLLMPNFNFIGTPIQTDVVVTAGSVSANIQHIDTIGCSFDPNDKTTILPTGTYSDNYVLQNTPFTYMIRFQNTGNDVAFSITIEDTLDANWDMSTFEILDYSHPLEATYTPDGVVRFYFPNIMLPDSGMNEPASHGFVSYRVKPKANLPEYTPLQNTAFIYFDSNAPVQTNTTSHIITSVLGLNNEKDWQTLAYYPNPMNEIGVLTYDNPYHQTYTFTLFDINGRIIYQVQDNDGKIEVFNQKTMAVGTYLFSLSDGKKTIRGKWMKD